MTQSSNLATAGILAGIVVVEWLGLRQSLRAFPWPHLVRAASTRPPTSPGTAYDIQIPGTILPATHVGWPFQWLSPKPERRAISTKTSLSVSVLVGWWTYCLIVGIGEPLDSKAGTFVALFLAFFRIIVYCEGVVTPLNLPGRLASGRLTIPGFDQIFVTPATVIALGLLGGPIVRHSGAWAPAATALVMALLFFTTLSGGPTLQKWKLTGQLRCRAPLQTAGNKRLLKPV